MNKTLTRSFCLLLCFTLFAAPLTVHAQLGASSDYIQGKLDGERNAKGQGWWFWVGCAGGLLGMSGVGLGVPFIPLFFTPDVPSDKLMGKSAEYIMGYTEGYQKKTQKINLRYSITGCASGVVAVVALVFALVYVTGSSSYY